MNWIKILGYLGLCMLLTYCSIESDDDLSANDCQEITKSSEYIPPLNDKDDFGIDSLYIEDDCLFLEVSYSGGCEDHTFELFWNENVVTSADNIFNAYHTILHLAHDDHGDNCEAFLHDLIAFNLLPLQQNNTSKITLEIRNTEDILVYKY